MKVKKISVTSYGNMRDRIFQTEPGLNVFYGPNEAGKSTLRSFITMTLFPKSNLKYPALRGSDSGSVTVELESGRELTFERDGRKCSGLGAEICGIDDKEYVSIYSMSPEDLRDVKGIEKGDIRNRFLTIPGGADLPRAYDSLNEERTKLLPDLKRSDKCEIAVLIKEEHDLKMKVRELQNRETGDNNYAALAARKTQLEEALKNAASRMEIADSVRTASHKSESKAEIVSKIAELQKTEESLAYAEGVDDSTYMSLEADLKRLDAELANKKAKVEQIRSSLSHYDTGAFLRNRKRIEGLDRLSDEYDYLVSIPSPIQDESSGQSFPVIPVAGAAVTLIGAVAAFTANLLAGGAVAAVGIILVIIGLRGSRKQSPQPARNTNSDRLAYMENSLRDVAKDVGIETHSFHSDVDLLNSTLKDILKLQTEENELADTENRRNGARNARDLYLSGFGGVAKFKQALADSEKLKEVRSKLSVLRESVETMEVVEVDTATADADYISARDEYNAADRELAAVKQALKDISEDMSVEDAISSWSAADSAVYAAAYRWARLMLEKIILDNASSEAYGSHRPDVLRRADEYLSCMTGGRYRMNTDPRVTEITVVENGTGSVKTMKECSSGLEDQVKLSLKMAVSLSLSKERPPVILDDVLLTSDSSRKASACDALMMLSKDIQVMYFTCDRETRDLLESAGATVHEV